MNGFRDERCKHKGPSRPQDRQLARSGLQIEEHLEASQGYLVPKYFKLLVELSSQGLLVRDSSVSLEWSAVGQSELHGRSDVPNNE